MLQRASAGDPATMTRSQLMHKRELARDASRHASTRRTAVLHCPPSPPLRSAGRAPGLRPLNSSVCCRDIALNVAASPFSLLPPQQLLMSCCSNRVNRVRPAPFAPEGVADEEGAIWVMGMQLGQVQLQFSYATSLSTPSLTCSSPLLSRIGARCMIEVLSCKLELSRCCLPPPPTPRARRWKLARGL